MSNRHDEQIDRLLTTHHRRGDGGASAECLDAETLAAWVDDRLAGPALARVEEHAAGCAHCQSMLAAMARTADVGAETQAGGATPRSRFWRMLPWAAPLTAAATAAALYVAVRPETARFAEADRLRPPSVARSEAPAEPAVENELPSPMAGANAAPGPSRDEKAAEVAPRSRAESAAAPVERGAGRSDVDALRDKQERRQLVSGDSAKAHAQVAQASPPPPLPEAKDLQRELLDVTKPAVPAAPPPPQYLPKTTEELTVVPSPARPASTAPPVASAYGQRSASRRDAAAALEETVTITGAPILIATPDPGIRWQVVDGRVVQISRDGGRTWTTQDARVSAPLTAGSAPSAAVCWIVGAAGTVLRTTDGRTWGRLDFPERADLARVLATSADAATVTTTDGRTFTTTDGGKTWTRPDQ